MRGPGWPGDEVAVYYGVCHLYGCVGAARVFYFGGAGGIAAETLAFDDVRGGENLSAVTERGDRLIGFGKVADDFEDFRFRAQIFGSAASGDYERIIIFGMHVGEVGVQREIVTRLFGVCLIAFEIVNGCAHGLAGFFVGANGGA